MPFSSLKRLSSAAATFIDQRPRATAAILAALAFAAHLHFFIGSARSHAQWDTAEYLANARNLAAGRGFLDAHGAIEARRTPGYPAFLVLFAPWNFNTSTVAAVQHLLAMGLVLLVFYGTRALIRDNLVAAAAAALLAVDSSQIYTADLVMTEMLMSIVLFVAVFWLARGRPAAAGLATGLSALVRPVSMYLWIPLAIWTAFAYRRKPAAVVMFVLCAWSLPGLWMWRNYERAGTASLSSVEGEMLYFYRAGGTLAMERSGFEYAPLPFHGEERFFYEFYHVTRPQLVRNAEQLLGARRGTMTQAEISDFEKGLARTILVQHPRAFVLLTICGVLHFIFDNTWDYASSIASSLVRVPMIGWLYFMSVASFVLALIGFVRLRRLNAPLAWLLAITLLYFVAVASGAGGEMWRLRAPVIPIYSILIACCIIRRHAGLLRTEDR